MLMIMQALPSTRVSTTELRASSNKKCFRSRRNVWIACAAEPGDAGSVGNDAGSSGRKGESTSGGGEGSVPLPQRLQGRSAKPRRRSKGLSRKHKRMAALAASFSARKPTPIKENPTPSSFRPKSKQMERILRYEGEPSEVPIVESVGDLSGFSQTPFVPVSIPENDEREVLELPYKSNGFSLKEPLDNDPSDLCVLPKPVYVISDCTGESAANTVRAALGQFENCFKMSVPANLLIFRFMRNEQMIYEIAERASKEDALVVFTLVDHNMVAAMRAACLLYEVKYVDLWSNLLDLMETHLEVIRSGVPLGSSRRQRGLSEDYYKMIEAVEFTRKMDDGAHPHRWKEADLLLLGVSRSGKTPLCIYLGQRGYKVANLPLVKGLTIPKELYEINQSKIFCLSIDPHTLLSIRKTRVGTMGVQHSSKGYADLKAIQEELRFAHNIYSQNEHWPVLDVTHCGVEETAARILKILTERFGDTHPIWNSM